MELNRKLIKYKAAVLEQEEEKRRFQAKSMQHGISAAAPSAAAPPARPRSASPAPSASNAIFPYQPRPHSEQYNGAANWNNQYRGNQSEIAALLRKLVNSDREKRERKREIEEKRAKEELLAKEKEEEKQKREDEEMKEAAREARLANLMAEQLAAFEARKKKETDKKEDETVFKKDPAKGKGIATEEMPKKKGGCLKIGEGDNKKRNQDVLRGGSPVLPDTGRQKTEVDNGFNALDAGLFLMNLNRVTRAVEAQQAAFSQIVREGKKVVVASTSAGGRKQYLEDMKKELMKEYKADLEVLCRKDNIKYINKKQAVNELAELRTRDAYGDTEEDEDGDLINDTGSESQEENPS
ncbi:hypothetical protein CBR_g48561 [Chara braunii]|uniref:Uncharacterized protein n=1 Tax=Chara braunii TaxID=69332 RepID=A0A388M325_CHABU|nr:hypothetical protein CBR_g48561 [Chara braunii]|eukprot:GBG88951.1 hypothetical protein CBR_g48561 [Chara braunii]